MKQMRFIVNYSNTQGTGCRKCPSQIVCDLGFEDALEVARAMAKTLWDCYTFTLIDWSTEKATTYAADGHCI